MNPFLGRVIAAQRKLEDGEPLDDYADVIELALTQLAKERRVPFEQTRSGFLVGTERWPQLAGPAHFRTILMHRKSPIWYPESPIGEISAFEVYCASQLEPPDPNVMDKDRGLVSDYAADVVFGDAPAAGSFVDPRRASVFGASYGGTHQKLLTEAPADLSGRKDARLTVYATTKKYVRELAEINTIQTVQDRDYLETWLRKYYEKLTDDIPKGDVVAVTDAWLQAHYYRGSPRSYPDERRKVADRVRKSCKHWLDKMDVSDNSLSRDIGKYLRDHVKVGVICEHQGDWKFKF